MKMNEKREYSDKRVLIMEDDMILTLSLELMLKKAGLQQIHRTRTGEEAVELARNESLDLIVADIYLGEGILGTEAVWQIQEHADIPVIYITGNSDIQNRNDAARTHFIDYLVKPITSEQLYKSLDKVWPSE
ncbi:MAG: response regulator [Balneolaceae bacterium]